MTKRRFTRDDLVAYIEDKIQMNTATQDEIELYENYIWNDELEVNYTYKSLIREMKAEYMGS